MQMHPGPKCSYDHRDGIFIVKTAGILRKESLMRCERSVLEEGKTPQSAMGLSGDDEIEAGNPDGLPLDDKRFHAVVQDMHSVLF